MRIRTEHEVSEESFSLEVSPEDYLDCDSMESLESRLYDELDNDYSMSIYVRHFIPKEGIQNLWDGIQKLRDREKREEIVQDILAEYDIADQDVATRIVEAL